jgi:hypothetical protein
VTWRISGVFLEESLLRDEPKLAKRPAEKNIVGGRVHIPMRADEATGFTMDATADVVPFGASGRAG